MLVTAGVAAYAGDEPPIDPEPEPDPPVLVTAPYAGGLDQMNVVHRPRLLSDNGSSYVASDLADWLDNRTSSIYAERRIIRRPRARSSAGIKHSRAESCEDRVRA